MNTTIGKYLIIIGLFIVVIGVLIYFLGDKLSWIGRLPGDIRIEKENLKIFIPVTTMILISILLTLIVTLIKKIF
ncbi:MAG: DUF2905 domain-containing protein [Bacteroidales bacterium]|nr:MAG: DUF2905 domain-containing protein [Bacteroidales bacterium]